MSQQTHQEARAAPPHFLVSSINISIHCLPLRRGSGWQLCSLETAGKVEIWAIQGGTRNPDIRPMGQQKPEYDPRRVFPLPTPGKPIYTDSLTSFLRGVSSKLPAQLPGSQAVAAQISSVLCPQSSRIWLCSSACQKLSECAMNCNKAGTCSSKEFCSA